MKNVVIIGSGPAGLTCAIYCARSGLKPLVFAGNSPGGQLVSTDFIENFPGIKSISGAELMSNMISHAEAVGAEIVYDNVKCVKKSAHDCFEIQLESETSILSRSVVVATGAAHKCLNISGEKSLQTKGFHGARLVMAHCSREKKLL